MIVFTNLRSLQTAWKSGSHYVNWAGNWFLARVLVGQGNSLYAGGVRNQCGDASGAQATAVWY